MKKSIFLFFAAILCAIGMNAATVTSDGTARLYFNMSTINWWVANSGNGNFGYFFNNSTGKNAWSAHSVQYDGNTYYVVIPKGTWAGVILTRNNTSTSPSWDNKWNQTGDITLSSTSNYISKFSEGSNTVTWGTAVKPASNAAVSAAASTIFVGASTTLTPSLTSNADINDIKSTTYTISPTTGASISGNTFTASAEGTYTITATVTYHPDGYSSLTSTATASTTTITAEVPAEETHDVTVSYICGETTLQDPTTVNTVGVETSVKVTAPEIAKYTFANWTLGADVATTDALTSNEINITTKAGGSDFTLVANYEKAKLTYTVTVPAGTENCYLVGAMNGWDEKNPYEMTKQGENVFTTTLEGVATTDEYKYISQKGSWDYADVQDANRTWTANDVVTAWKDPLATNVHLAGTMTDWDNNKIEFKKATKGATTASIILNLTAGEYKFKIVDNGSWLGNNATIDKTISEWTFAGDQGDCPLKATIAGDYTFTWAISTKKLSVTYPTICAITANANDAAMGTIAGAGNYGKGSTATLTATPNDGYLFVNWTKGSEEVSTDATYSFKVEEAVELVANFEAAPEEVHNVTVSYVCGGNKIAEDQTVAAVGVTTPKTAEAPAIFGYTFTSWTLGADVTSTDATANPISINTVASGSDFTLTANYTEIPKVTVYFVNNKKWSKVCAYGWGGSVGENPAWPGQDITANKEAEQIVGFDVYSYSVVPGSYVNIKFTNGSGAESANFKWTDGKYYYMDAANDYVGGTKEEVTKELTPTYTVAGDNRIVFGEEWAPAKVDNDMVDQGDGTYKWTKSEIALKKNTQIKFKVVKNHDWGKGSWPGEDWVINTITKDGYYTITITFKESDQSITATATWTGEAPFKDFSNQPTTLYFHPSFHWTSDNAEFAAYFYNEGFGADAEPTWVDMTDDNSDGIYELANAKKHEYIIICRMNPNRTETRWNQEGDEDAKKPVWNQISTGLSIPNTAGDLNTCLAFWTNCQGDVPTSECTWVAPTPLTDKNWDAFVAAYNGKTINAVVERSFKSSQLHTLCLPFDLPTSWLGDGAQAHQITSVVSRTAEELELKTTQCNTLFAGQPYIIQPIKGEEYEHIIVSNVTVENVTASDYTVLGGGCQVTMQAVSATDGTQTNGTTEYYIGAKDGKLYKEATNKLGLRALVVMTDTEGQPLSVRARVVVGENEATGIEDLFTTDAPVKVIENGQLIIIRDGEKFNAQGIKL